MQTATVEELKLKLQLILLISTADLCAGGFFTHQSAQISINLLSPAPSVESLATRDYPLLLHKPDDSTAGLPPAN